MREQGRRWTIAATGGAAAKLQPRDHAARRVGRVGSTHYEQGSRWWESTRIGGVLQDGGKHTRAADDATAALSVSGIT